MRISKICEKCVHRKTNSMTYPCNICNPECNKYQEMKQEKCGYADQYQAIRPPTCGCLVCNEKWNSRKV